jgi:hypothetical protein
VQRRMKGLRNVMLSDSADIELQVDVTDSENQRIDTGDLTTCHRKCGILESENFPRLRLHRMFQDENK